MCEIPSNLVPQGEQCGEARALPLRQVREQRAVLAQTARVDEPAPDIDVPVRAGKQLFEFAARQRRIGSLEHRVQR